ncbi:hypothetical protein AB0O87_03470 [Microbacterium sp. NPDC076768]|uniref:hypothetical protein n=1 Tax=Microbacterium sp. NPDC076768 TaxID=3154858 RepID=UPI003439581B
MTIASLSPSERTRDSRVHTNAPFSAHYVTIPFSPFWDSLDILSKWTPFAVETDAPTALAHTHMTVPEITALFSRDQFVDVSPSDNDTTYIEWETSDGFSSLEIGHTEFAFSFIADDSSQRDSYGEGGSLKDRALIASLIRTHS